MNVKTNMKQVNEKTDMNRAIAQRFMQVCIGAAIQAAILFGFSGRADWSMAWLYIGVYVGGIIVNALVLTRRHPELIAERAQVKEGTKGWDRILSLTESAIAPLTALVVIGLDKRFGWTPSLGITVQLAALAITMSGYAIWGWAMAANKFFSGTVRIQTERGHAVATAGPYQYVRHPGYTGMLIFTLATPIALGSLWALVPAALTVVVIFIRTALEDVTLREELDGYRAYAARTRYRLIPGIW